MGSVRRGIERVTARDVAVCVDTGVLTSTLRIGSPLEARYRRHLTGRRLVIATQVVAEARYGALRAGWGETAFRQEAVAAVVLLPLAFWLGRTLMPGVVAFVHIMFQSCY